MKILGIDPGNARLGYALIDYDVNSKHKTLNCCGIIETSKDLAEKNRLAEIRRDLLELVNTLKPDVMSVEQLFFFKNPKTIIPVAQARGVILEIAGTSNIELYEYTPLQIKQVITGRGRAEKSLVEELIMNEFQITEKIKPDDAVDAVAIAETFIRSDLVNLQRALDLKS